MHLSRGQKAVNGNRSISVADAVCSGRHCLLPRGGQSELFISVHDDEGVLQLEEGSSCLSCIDGLALSAEKSSH